MCVVCSGGHLVSLCWHDSKPACTILVYACVSFHRLTKPYEHQEGTILWHLYIMADTEEETTWSVPPT